MWQNVNREVTHKCLYIHRSEVDEFILIYYFGENKYKIVKTNKK